MWTIPKGLVAAAALTIAGFSTMAQAQTYYMGKDSNIERGTKAMMKGNLETASRYLGRAAQTDLGHDRLVPVLNNLCAVDYALGKLESAEAACSRAISEDRHFWRAYVNRGNVLKAKGQFDAARDDYAKAVRLNPNGELPKRALARLMEEQPQRFAAAQ